MNEPRARACLAPRTEPFVANLDEETQAHLFYGSARFSRSLFFEPQDEDNIRDPQGLAHNHGLYWLTANLSEQQPLLLVVDDAYQGITDVVRGRDLCASTHVHRLLQALLGLPAYLQWLTRESEGAQPE